MTDKYREISLSWVPDGYANVMEISDDVRNKIGTFKSMRVNYVVTPITFYAISAINNRFLLREFVVNEWREVVLTVGNYTSIQFAEHLKSKLEAAWGNYTYTVVINPGGTIKISISDGVYFHIAFIKSKQSEKIWGVRNTVAGPSGIIENPPSQHQIDNAFIPYTSVDVMPNEIIIDSQNKLFLLYENEHAMVYITVNLTEGVYTRKEYVAELANALNAAGEGTYTVSINISGKLIISDSAAGENFKIAFVENIRTIEKIWGVQTGTPGAKLEIPNPPSPLQISSLGTGGVYVSHNPIQLWGPDKLLIVSEALESQFVNKNIDITQNTDGVIFSIPITVSPLTQQTYFNPNQNMTLTSGIKLPRTIDMNITDESGNGINFNGGECYVNLIVS